MRKTGFAHESHPITRFVRHQVRKIRLAPQQPAQIARAHSHTKVEETMGSCNHKRAAAARFDLLQDRKQLTVDEL
jgi:hypothetical protein